MKILVIDFSVMVYSIEADVKNYFSDGKKEYNLYHLAKGTSLSHLFPNPLLHRGLVPEENLNERIAAVPKVIERFIAAKWLTIFLRGPQYLTQSTFHPVVAMDYKPYWRSNYVADYKGGRPPKPDSWFTVDGIGRRIIKSLNLVALEYPRYEADDMAGAIVKAQLISHLAKPASPLSSAKIMLWTVDTDWQQLVNDNVTWYNHGPWEPLIRDAVGCKVWAKKRLKVDIGHPQDIVAVKCIQGDRSDNLPPNTKPYLIDLLNPHPRWRPLSNPPIVSKIMSIPDSPTNYQYANKYAGAREVLRNVN